MEEQLISEIRAIVISCKGGITLNNLRRKFSMPSCLTLNCMGSLFIIATTNTYLLLFSHNISSWVV